MGTTGATEHDVNPSQEAGYNLPVVGKSGGVASCRLSGESGNDHPAVRLCASSLVPPLCTGYIVCSSRTAGGPGRPDGAGTRCTLPRNSQVRSNVKMLSVLDRGQTKYESLSAVNRTKGTPASNVQSQRHPPLIIVLKPGEVKIGERRLAHLARPASFPRR